MSGPIVSFNEVVLEDDLASSCEPLVQDALNGLLEEESDDLIGVERHGHTAGGMTARR